MEEIMKTTSNKCETIACWIVGMEKAVASWGVLEVDVLFGRLSFRVVKDQTIPRSPSQFWTFGGVPGRVLLRHIRLAPGGQVGVFFRVFFFCVGIVKLGEKSEVGFSHLGLLKINYPLLDHILNLLGCSK